MRNKINVLFIGGSGYVGSKLCEFFFKNNKFIIRNIDLKSSIYTKISKKINYNKLNLRFINKFNYIIILAAHSSTKQCLNDKVGTIQNNIIDLIELLLKIKSSKAIPIFISTTAVYNNLKKPGFESMKLSDNNLLNLYDISKRYIEKFIKKNLKRYYILRMGTVSGKSPNQDKKLIINKMYYDSKKLNKIFTVSEHSKKSILFIDDLCKAIELILLNKRKKYGIYNLNSLNLTVGKIAKKISIFKKVKIIKKEGQSGYSFFSSNKKFSRYFKMQFTTDLNKILKSLD